MFWKHFVKNDDGGTCKLCQQNVKTSGNTTNLRRHIERYHLELFNPGSSDTSEYKNRKRILMVIIFCLIK